MASKRERRRAVTFCHLSCAVKHNVTSMLAFAVSLEVAPPESHLPPAWHVFATQAEGRDNFDRRRTALLGVRHKARETRKPTGSQEMLEYRLPYLLQPGGELRPAREDEEVHLYCTKCSAHIVVSESSLAACAENHPGHRIEGAPMIAYVADRGELLYGRDSYAEELARRDAKTRARLRARA